MYAQTIECWKQPKFFELKVHWFLYKIKRIGLNLTYKI
jgi:hypothetical protein